VPPLLCYALLSASVDVYAAHQEQSLDPIAVGAISFTIAALVFGVPQGARRGIAMLRPLRTHPFDVAALNVAIAVTWLFLLYALKLLEPAVVNSVALAIGPALTVLLGPTLRRGTTVLPAEVAAAAGILAFIGILSWASLAGMSGLRHIGAGAATLGLAATILSGLGTTGNVIYSKRLSEAGYRPGEVLPIRYFLMIGICWALVADGHGQRLAATFVPAAVIALIGVVGPNYLVQLGLGQTEPITVALLANLAPVLTYLLQLLDSRLRPSALSLAGVLGITTLVAAGVIARGRHDARAART
jgi:drug/metabolite transporter (DMT)-like permease